MVATVPPNGQFPTSLDQAGEDRLVQALFRQACVEAIDEQVLLLLAQCI